MCRVGNVEEKTNVEVYALLWNQSSSPLHNWANALYGHKVTGIPVARPDTVRGKYTTVVKLMISAKDRSPFHQSSPPP